MKTNFFQIFIIAASACVFLGGAAAWARGWASRREGLFWIILSILAGVAAADPNLTTEIARKLGIDRGMNLVLYCTVVVMILGFWMTYVRLRDIQRDLTVLVRQMALLQAESQRADQRPQHDESRDCGSST